MPSGILDKSIYNLKGVCFVFSLEIPVLNANSKDPDQTPRFAASELGLHCLPMSL